MQSGKRPNFPVGFKARVAALACEPGVSVSRLAREHGLDTTMLFRWKRPYRAAELDAQADSDPTLLPVSLVAQTETLDDVPGHFKVVRHVRPKYSCACCSHVVQAPAPSRPIDRGILAPGLLAQRIVSKYAWHLPLYRQAQMYAHDGVELEGSAMSDAAGGVSRMLTSLVEALRRYVLLPGKLHGGDIPVPVLAPGKGSAKTGRLWAYVRDNRPAGDPAAPAVWFTYSPHRKGEHTQHLRSFTGIRQADAFGRVCTVVPAGQHRRRGLHGPRASQVT